MRFFSPLEVAEGGGLVKAEPNGQWVLLLNSIIDDDFFTKVCSRLAYECLSAIKRGISSPRFVESDPHFGLLTRAIQVHLIIAVVLNIIL